MFVSGGDKMKFDLVIAGVGGQGNILANQGGNYLIITVEGNSEEDWRMWLFS